MIEQATKSSVVRKSQSDVPSGMIELEQWASFSDAEHIREEWDSLVERIDGDLFSTFDWCAIWWKHFGRKRRLVLLTTRRDGRLVGVLPFFRETIRWGPFGLRVVRIVGCDHGVTTCNLAIDPDWVGEVIRLVMERIERDAPWDLMHVGEIPGYATHVAELVDAFRACPQVGTVEYNERFYPHDVFDCPPDFEAWLASLSAKERRNVRHDEREFEKRAGAERVSPRGERDLRAAFDDLVRLHGDHWTARGRLGHFGDWIGAEAFHRDVLAAMDVRGRSALVAARAQGRTIATEYAIRFGRRVHWIIGGRDPDVTSRVGFCALLRKALRDGATVIDALPGSYDYKRRLGAQSLRVKTVAVFPRGRRGRVRYAIVRGITQLVRLVYHRTWFWHCAPWLRFRFPRVFPSLLRAGLWSKFVRARFLVAGRHDSTSEPAAPPRHA